MDPSSSPDGEDALRGRFALRRFIAMERRDDCQIRDDATESRSPHFVVRAVSRTPTPTVVVHAKHRAQRVRRPSRDDDDAPRVPLPTTVRAHGVFPERRERVFGGRPRRGGGHDDMRGARRRDATFVVGGEWDAASSTRRRALTNASRAHRNVVMTRQSATTTTTDGGGWTASPPRGCARRTCGNNCDGWDGTISRMTPSTGFSRDDDAMRERDDDEELKQIITTSTTRRATTTRRRTRSRSRSRSRMRYRLVDAVPRSSIVDLRGTGTRSR